MLPTNEEIYQILTPEGEVVGDVPAVPADELKRWYRWMILGRVYSDRMVALQRQGRMGTFAPLNGQEAASVGLAAPLQPEDWLVASYRENLSYMVKGVPALALMKQWGGDIADNYPPAAHCLPFQIVLGNQLLHATGIAMALQYEQKPHVVISACGDGATSEGDFHEALNLAGVFKAPVVFVVQNNGWAISVPCSRQTAARRIAHRGLGYGIPGCTVDGNDVLAVYQVVAESVARARAGEGPTLIEAVTYRMGAHTTADDPRRYRSEAELQAWVQRDPITRFRTFLLNRNLLTEAEDQALHQAVAAEMQTIVEAYESLPPPQPQHLFELVYADMPPHLQRQRDAFIRDSAPAPVPVASRPQPQPRELIRELPLAR
ncbi:MAG: pyruvate dehydrogenase (acetyl-transferring) E1 component subunit alpha [Anaerolineae bacterium]